MSEPLVVELEDEEGLVFWPAFSIASLVPEAAGRWRAVDGRGRIAYRPSPPPAGPWVELGAGLVLPPMLTANESAVWLDPAGFALGEGELPSVAPPEPRPALTGLPCSPDQVIRLESVTRWSCQWVTEVGGFLREEALSRVAALMPELVKINRSLWIPRFRLRRLELGGEWGWLETDDGERRKLSWFVGKQLAQRLGYQDSYHLQPYQSGLWRDGKRDYPFELARATGATLQQHFQSARRLMSHMIWQAFRYRQQSLSPDYGDSHREFWYRPLAPALFRAGMLSRAELDVQVSEEGHSSETLYDWFRVILSEMVGDDRLFCYRELGFVDAKPGQRGVGALHPQVVLLIEKESMRDVGQRLAEEFGLSWLASSGHVTLISSEYLSAALAAAGVEQVRVLALTDWDPAGWWIGQTLPRHLNRFGLPTNPTVDYLVRPECFSSEELALYSIPCATTTPKHQTLLANWLAETGGVNGKPLGIHADHLMPYERLRQRCAELLGC